MEDKTIVTCVRTLSGAAIFITSMVTGINGAYQVIALFLMGVPMELVTYAKKEEKEEATLQV